MQFYLVAGLMLVLVFVLALILILTSSKPAIPVELITSSITSDISSSKIQSEVISSSKSQEVIKPASSEAQIPKSQSSGTAFTPEQIKAIDELILKYELMTVPLSSISSATSKEEQNSQEHKDDNAANGDNSSDTSSEIMVEVKSNVSIYYEDLTNGEVFYNNEEYKYFIASLIKAPYAMYLYNLAEQDKCDLEEKLSIEYKNIQEGTGKIKDMDEKLFPISLSVRELISYAIRFSDNTAMETLRKKYNHVGYLEYAKSLGLNYPNDVLQIVNGKITAKDCGIYIKEIYRYIETGKYGLELKEDMLNTTNKLIQSKYPVVRKYGWADLSFHDMAVVYSPNPYLLVILSDKDMGYKTDYKFMYELSNLISSFHQKKYKYS